MGKSAKLMKRPTKAEKVSRTVNKPATARSRQRSLSPDTAPHSAIPLFNTSVPGRPGAVPRNHTKPNPSNPSAASTSRMQMDDPEADDLGLEFDGPAQNQSAAPRKLSMKDKLKNAKESVRVDQQRSFAKLDATGRKSSKGRDKFSLGVDYVKLHESRPGGMFKKKLR